MESPGPIRIRRAGPDDLPRIHALHKRAFPPGIAFAREVLDGLVRHSQATCLLAEDARGPVGFAGAVQGSHDAARLWTIHVAARARGHGIGDRLWRELEEILRARGVRRVELEVWSGNGPAIALYRKHGFVETGRNEDSFTRLEPPGALEMAKKIARAGATASG